MIDNARIEDARGRLKSAFVATSQNPGAILVRKADPAAAAVGQHLYATSAQRGLHGTAAVMRVLAQSTLDQEKAFFSSLLRYCEHRRAIEAQIPDGAEEDDLVKDEHNVIKIAEVLYSLAGASTVAGAEQFAIAMSNRLISGKNDTSSWSYLLNGPPSVSALLPTSWAVLALAGHGYDVSAELDFMESQLGVANQDKHDITVRVFALYVLMRVRGARARQRLRSWFNEYWEKLSPLLFQDLEANIEYLSAGRPRVSYVRVPWQLYLIACAAQLAPYRCFASPRAQGRLEHVVYQVMENGGLVYPHSGSIPSTRTNSILFEALGDIQRQLEIRKLPLAPFHAFGRFLGLGRNRVVRWGGRLIAAVIIIATLIAWTKSSEMSWVQIAPNLVTSLLIFLFTLRRSS